MRLASFFLVSSALSRPLLGRSDELASSRHDPLMRDAFNTEDGTDALLPAVLYSDARASEEVFSLREFECDM